LKDFRSHHYSPFNQINFPNSQSDSRTDFLIDFARKPLSVFDHGIIPFKDWPFGQKEMAWMCCLLLPTLLSFTISASDCGRLQITSPWQALEVVGSIFQCATEAMRGGAIHMEAETKHAMIRSCRFLSCSTSRVNGAEGGAVYLHCTTASIDGCYADNCKSHRSQFAYFKSALSSEQSLFYLSTCVACADLIVTSVTGTPNGACTFDSPTWISLLYLNFTRCCSDAAGNPFEFSAGTIWTCEGLVVFECSSAGSGIVQYSTNGKISCANFWQFEALGAVITVANDGTLILEACAVSHLSAMSLPDLSGGPNAKFILVNCQFSYALNLGTKLLSSMNVLFASAGEIQMYQIDMEKQSADCSVNLRTVPVKIATTKAEQPKATISGLFKASDDFGSTVKAVPTWLVFSSKLSESKAMRMITEVGISAKFGPSSDFSSSGLIGLGDTSLLRISCDFESSRAIELTEINGESPELTDSSNVRSEKVQRSFQFIPTPALVLQSLNLAISSDLIETQLSVLTQPEPQTIAFHLSLTIVSSQFEYTLSLIPKLNLSPSEALNVTLLLERSEVVEWTSVYFASNIAATGPIVLSIFLTDTGSLVISDQFNSSSVFGHTIEIRDSISLNCTAVAEGSNLLKGTKQYQTAPIISSLTLESHSLADSDFLFPSELTGASLYFVESNGLSLSDRFVPSVSLEGVTVAVQSAELINSEKHLKSKSIIPSDIFYFGTVRLGNEASAPFSDSEDLPKIDSIVGHIPTMTAASGEEGILTIGAIIGIVIGILALIMICVILFVIFGLRRRKAEYTEREEIEMGVTLSDTMTVFDTATFVSEVAPDSDGDKKDDWEDDEQEHAVQGDDRD
jgi:hypothetical protein